LTLWQPAATLAFGVFSRISALENGLADLYELPYRYLGDKENNRGPVEAMESTENALYEKVMNRFDAVIEFKQRTDGFASNPTNAAEAMAEIGSELRQPGVYLITTKANTRTGGLGQPKKRANVIVVDEGVGILPGAFPSTIISLEGSNKLSNPLMAGSYGFGSAAIYRDSEFSIIWSRSMHDPGTIGFTVIYQRFNKSARFPSYVYLVGDDQGVLTFKTADLPSDMIILPSQIVSKNVMEATALIPMPEHGTGVKVFELENFSAGPRIYSFLRDRGFGMPMPCRFRNGVEKGDGVEDDGAEADTNDIETDLDLSAQRGTTKRLYNATGLRYSINNPEARRAYPVAFHQTPIAIMEVEGKPQATLECWVLERAGDKNTKVAANSSEPVIESVLGKERRNSPCYVTLNGMTQENIGTFVMLRNVGLPYLRYHLVVKINCDQMDPQVKGRFFTSNRERLTRESQEWIRGEITKFLEMQAERDGELHKLNAKYRDAIIAADSPDVQDASRRGMELLARLLKSGVIGSILTRFGGLADRSPNGQSATQKSVGRGGTGDAGGGQRSADGNGTVERRGGGNPNPPVLKPVPDFLEVRKHTFKQGATEWVVIRTNAHNDWDGLVKVDFPEYLSVIDRVPLTNGRVSYYVKCADDIALGVKGKITAAIDLKKINRPPLIDEAEFTVIRGTAGLEMPLKSKTTLPYIELVAVEPNNANWEYIDDQAMRADLVAFNILEEPGKVRVFWNKAFPAFTSALDEIMRRYKSVVMAEKFKVDYQTHISVLTLAILEDNLASDSSTESDLKAAHRMRGEAVTANAMMLTIMMSHTNRPNH
jgi:hypothetical protein